MRTTFKNEEQKHTGKSEFIGATSFFFAFCCSTVDDDCCQRATHPNQCVAIIWFAPSLSRRALAPFNIL